MFDERSVSWFTNAEVHLRYVNTRAVSTPISDWCHVARSTFGERLGYARWLYHLVTGEAPAYAEIGRATGRTGQAVSGWMGVAESPADYRVHAPTAEFLGVDERWLFRDEGEPPRPELWKEWIKERRRAPRAGGFRRTDVDADAKRRKA